MGGGLAIPLWLLLNACVLSVTSGLPLKEAAILPAALAAVGLSLALGPVVASRAGATTVLDGVALGLRAGLAAAVPVLILVVPGAAALALGTYPLVEAARAGNAVTPTELAWPVVVQTTWAGPLFALMPVLWLTLAGGLSGGAFGLVASLRRRETKVAPTIAVSQA
jgi:hypothetical protein